jgi:hypothetical protein
MHCQPGNDPIEPHVPIATGCASMCRITNPATVIQYCPTRADVRAVDSQDYESNLGDFQESCHSCAAVQAACINGSCPDSLSSSGG